MKIMFVCTGNICRSAMAAAILKNKIKGTELENKIEVFSAGTYAETGAHATYTAIEAVEEMGIDLHLHKATNIIDSNIEEMDLILCATVIHKNHIISMFPNLASKTYTIKEYVNYDLENGMDISDPWGYSLAIYRQCASVLEICIDKLIDKVKKQN